MKRVRSRMIPAGAMLLLLMATTTLQGQWTQTSGPAGARISTVGGDGTTLVAIITDEVHHLIDGTWQQVGALPAVEQVGTPRGDLRMMTFIDGVLLLHYRGHLLRSTDYGVTFESVGTASGVFTDGEWFYTLTDDPTFQTAPVLSRSADGETFTQIGTLPLFSSTPVAWNDALYCSFGYGTDLFRSVDNGQSWDTLHPEFAREGRETVAGGSSIGSMTATSSGLYAASGAEVFHSTDGESWTNVSANLPEPMMITQITANDRHVFITTQNREVFSYDPKSGTWAEIDVPIARQVVPFTDGAVIVTLTGGLYEVENGSTEVADINGGLIRTNVFSMGGTGTVVFANAENLCFRTDDGGETWERMDELDGSSWIRFSTNPSNGDVYALNAASQFNSPLRSTDQGETWGPFGPTYEWDPEWYRGDIQEVLATDDAIYLSLSEYGPSKSHYSWRSGGVFRSDDNGVSWEKVDNGLPYNVETTAPVSDIIEVDGTLIVTTAGGTFRSSNRGDFWSRAMNGISSEDVEKGGGLLFAVGSTVFLKSYHGFYRSDDYGKNWVATELDLPTGVEYSWNIFSLDGEIYMQSYRPSSTEPLGYFEYMLLKFDGTEWKDVTDWQPEGVIFTDMIRAGDLYYAGTAGHGVWTLSRDFSIGSSSVPTAGAMPWGLDLSVAPNPANGRVGIEVSAEDRGLIDLSIVDPIGRRIRDIHTGEVTPGTDRFEIETSGLSAGTYYVRMVAADGSTVVRSLQVVR